MSVTVRIPTTMRPLTGGEKQVSVETGTLSDVIAALEAAHPGLRRTPGRRRRRAAQVREHLRRRRRRAVPRRTRHQGRRRNHRVDHPGRRRRLTSTVAVEDHGPVRIVSIDRPAVRNAVDGPTAQLLYDIFVDFDADDAVSVAVLTGRGRHVLLGCRPRRDRRRPRQSRRLGSGRRDRRFARSDGADPIAARQAGDRRRRRASPWPAASNWPAGPTCAWPRPMPRSGCTAVVGACP